MNAGRAAGVAIIMVAGATYVGGRVHRSLTFAGLSRAAIAQTLPPYPVLDAQGPPVCTLLADPAMRARLSGGGLRALMRKCAPKQQRKLDRRLRADNRRKKRLAARSRRSSPVPLVGGSAQVNNSASDTYPHITQSETSVAVSGSSNNTIVIGWNDSATSGMGFGRSTDGGTTWADQGPAPSQFISDPLVVSDSSGTFF